MKIERILCPTDLSPNSIAGIEYAGFLAKQNQAVLIVLHVTSYPPAPLSALNAIDTLPLQSPLSLPPAPETLLRQAQSRVDRFLARIHTRAAVRVCLGNAAEEIVTTARYERADLIVMAKRRLSFLHRLATASTSEKVGRRAPCPVLTVCPEARPESRAKTTRSVGMGLLVGSEA